MSVTTVVFDLDGTIYQNNAFYRDYLRFLLSGTEYEDWYDELCDCVRAVLSGDRLAWSSFYDAGALTAHSPAELFRLLADRRVPALRWEDAVDERYVYLGDLWALVSLVGRAMGLLGGERRHEIYRLTREKMSRDGMRGNPRLRDAVRRLSERFRTVLLTNSYESTARDFLRQIGFENVFAEEVFSADKPRRMVEKLLAICPELQRNPAEILTIGDHAFNDLMPLQRLGARSFWINPFPGVREPAYDLKLSTTDELAEILENMVSCDQDKERRKEFL